MEPFKNPHRGKRLESLPAEVPFPSVDSDEPKALLERCPASQSTPLVSCPELADKLGIGGLLVKDERERMGLGSFKALGAAYVVAQDAVATGAEDLSSALKGETYVTASAGNHGLSVAAGARVFGANSVIYIANTVPESFAERLREKGARVERGGDDYQASLDAAFAGAEANGWNLLSDTSWEGYNDRPHRLMEGYLKSADETVEVMEAPPTHIFLQAGVGGLAGAMAAYFRAKWGDVPTIVVVEPANAPALLESARAGRSVIADGPTSNMGRLDCKEPSLIALAGLARDADYFMTITEEEGSAHLQTFAEHSLATSPSGGAGLSGLFEARSSMGLSADSVVLCIISEGVAE